MPVEQAGRWAHSVRLILGCCVVSILSATVWCQPFAMLGAARRLVFVAPCVTARHAHDNLVKEGLTRGADDLFSYLA